MAIRDEQYVDQWANARVVGTVRYHCEEGEMAYMDTRDTIRHDEDQCAELQRRLRSGVGTWEDHRLR